MGRKDEAIGPPMYDGPTSKPPEDDEKDSNGSDASSDEDR